MSETSNPLFHSHAVIIKQNEKDAEVLFWVNDDKLYLPKVELEYERKGDNLSKIKVKAKENLRTQIQNKAKVYFLPSNFIKIGKIKDFPNSQSAIYGYCFSGKLKEQKNDGIAWVPINEFDFSMVEESLHPLIIPFINRQKDVLGDKEAVLSELRYLRDEVLNRFGIRNKMLEYTILSAVGFLAFVATIGQTKLLLLFPFLGVALAESWTHSDIRISEIGKYVKTKFEPFMPGLNWENFLFQYYSKRPLREGKKQERFALWVFIGSFWLLFILALIINMPELFDMNLDSWSKFKDWVNIGFKIKFAGTAFKYCVTFGIGLIINGFLTWKTFNHIKKRRGQYNEVHNSKKF